MKRILLIIIALTLSIPCAFANAVPAYYLTDIKTKSDIDYEIIENIDALTLPYPKDSTFQIGDLPTVPGKYTVYKFLNAFMGTSSTGKNKLFHNLLVIKTDDKKNILDAYHYTLEWQDSPSINLYKSRTKGVVLESGLSVQKLGMTNPEGVKLKHSGFIDNVYQGKTYF